MKHRFAKSTLFLSLLTVFIFSGFIGAILPIIGTSKASAAASYDYIFDTPNDGSSLKALNDALNDEDESSAAIAATDIRVKGGVFGNKQFKLDINTGRSGCAQANTLSWGDCGANTGDHFGGQDDSLYVYSGTYTCQDGKFTTSSGPGNKKAHYDINFNVSINMGADGQDHSILTNNKLENSLRMHWVGFGSTETDAITYYSVDKPGTARTVKTIPMKDLPDSCFPPKIPDDIKNSSSKDTQKDTDGNVNLAIPIYPAASAAIKKAWGDVSNANTSGGTGSAGSGGATSPTLECDTKFTNPLSWISCPAIDGLSTLVSTLDDVITSQLSIGSSDSDPDNPNQIFCDSKTTGSDVENCRAYHQAWESFRNIALGLLVLAALAIILSEMAGMEIFDAYTLRKMLPRLIIAAIAITLSWQLMDFLVTLTNAIGYGIRYLIYEPFVRAGLDTATLGGGGKTAVGFLALGGLFALGIFGVLSFALTAAIGVIIAFLTLVIRQLLIIVLVIVAPVAIVLYVLPNTQKYYKIWWESFFKALMMFPLIAAMIATGRVFAAVSANNTSTISQMIGFAAYFAPYFLLPMTYKFAGSAMGAIGGFVSSQGQGMSQGLKGYRRKKFAQNMQDTKDFSRFSDRNPLTRGLNNVGGAVSNGAFRRKKFKTRKEAGQAAYGARSLKDDPLATMHQGDDAVQLALADNDLAKSKLSQATTDHEAAVRATSAARAAYSTAQTAHAAAPTAATAAALASAQSNLDSAEATEVGAKADIDSRQHGLDVVSSMGSKAKSEGVRRQALSTLAKTGFQFAEGQQGYDELRGVAKRLAGGDEGKYRSIMNEAQYGLRTAGRFDLGGINNGAGYDPGAGTSKASLYELANAKVESIGGFVAAAGPLGVSGDAGEKTSILHKELVAMRPSAKGKAAQRINAEIARIEALNVGGMTLRDYNNAPHASGETKQVPIMDPNTGQPEIDPVTRSVRTRTIAKTNGDIAEAKARTYERPDPNNL